MNKFLTAAVVAIISILCAASPVQAQERGNVGLGPRLAVYSHTGGEPVYGIGGEVRINISDPIRIAPSLMWLFNSECSLEAACDLHFMIRTARHWYIYPLAGASFHDMRGWNFAIDAGLGTDYAVGRHIDISAGLKWMIEIGDRRNPIAVWVGTTFKF